MNSKSLPTLCAAILLALAAMLVAIACTAPTKGTFKASAMGATIEITVDSSGNSSTTATGSLPAGKCLKISYVAADGSILSSKVISVPGSCQIPAGAVHQTFELVDCPPPAGTLSSSSGMGSQHVNPSRVWLEVVGFPIQPDTQTGGAFFNAAFDIRVLCSPGQDPLPSAIKLALAGPGSVVPSGVDVRYFAQMIPELGGALLRVADTDTITQYRFDWNGIQGYADLSTGTNVTQYNAPNHWNVIESFIPVTDFNGNVGDWNGGRTETQTVKENAPSTHEFEYQTLAF